MAVQGHPAVGECCDHAEEYAWPAVVLGRRMGKCLSGFDTREELWPT